MAATERTDKADQRLYLLVGLVVLVGAIGILASGLLVVASDLDRGGVPWTTVGALVALVAVGDRVKVDIRIRSTTHGITWVDAAILIGLAIAPFPWVVLATALGVTISSTVRQRRGIRFAFGVAKETACAFLGGLVIALAGMVGSVDLSGVVVLGLAFVAITLFDECTTIPVIALASRTRIVDRFRTNGDVRLVTAVGRFVVAVLAVLTLQAQPGLVYGLPLAVLLGHLWHERWVRAREERQAWQDLAAATERFTGVDLDLVLREGVTRGVKLFSADELEVEVWLGDRQRLVRGAEEVTYDGSPGGAPADERNVYAVALRGYQGRRDIGVLRLRFRHQVKITEREQAMVASYAAALDTAVRNAAAYQQLGEATRAHAHAAAHDALTGLPNRRELERQLMAALDGRHERDCRIAMVLIDLRHFKEVNDALGHLAGDRVLVQVAQRLADAAGPEDLVARFGGDEFAVLLRHAWRPARVEARASRVLRALAEPLEVDGLPIIVEANGGVSLAVDPQDGPPPAGGTTATATPGAVPDPSPAATTAHSATSADSATAGPGFRDDPRSWMVELMRRADVALYQAKRLGRPLVSYTVAQDPADRERLVLAGQLPRAVSQREFVLHFQPIADLGTGQVVGAEALARWRHPTRGQLNPRWFLDLLERSAHLPAFTAAVLDDALSAAAIWRAAGHDLRVSVNISARSLLDASLPAQVRAALQAHRTEPDRLCLELTETLALSQLDTVDQVLTQLQELGVQLALDDFGTGFSSLAVLSRIPVHQLKIDRSFVQALLGPPEAGTPALGGGTAEPGDLAERVAAKPVPAMPAPRAPAEDGAAGGESADLVALVQARAVVRSTVQLGRTLDLAVVAEGVESPGQRQLLWELGCASGQGHLFSPPVPADALMALLTHGVDGRPGTVAPPLADGNVPRLRPVSPRRPTVGPDAGPGQRSAG